MNPTKKAKTRGADARAVRPVAADDEADEAGHAPDLDRLFLPLAAAYVRGRCADLRAAGSDAEVVTTGARRGLRVHRFKRTGLSRVARVVGALRGLAPESLLDVGSGRGTFLWPLLDAMPGLAVTSIERDPVRAFDIAAVGRGARPAAGTPADHPAARLRAVRGDAERLPLADGAVDGASILEVLEHVQDPAAAAREALRVTRRFVLASVPSMEDDNPEHLRLFSADDLAELFLDAGARRARIEHVAGHRIAVVLK